MKQSAVFVVACLLWLGAQSDVQAEVACVTYYQPMIVYSPPIMVAPHTVCCAPVPTVSYHPVASVRTRYRPILGGTVTRVRYRYAPVYHLPVVYAY